MAISYGLKLSVLIRDSRSCWTLEKASFASASVRSVARVSQLRVPLD